MNKTEEYAIEKFYKNFKWYNHIRFKNAVKLINIKGKKILDFGCASQKLKKYRPFGCSYYGYDLNEKYSDLQGHWNWQDIKNVDVVFALDVFEHMDEEELYDTINMFKNMSIKYIVAGFPYETSPINKALSILFGSEIENHITHQIGWKQISKTLNKYYDLKKTKCLFWSNWITLWELK